MHSHQHSQLIKDTANKLGFLSCGIAQAGFLAEEAPRLTKWLNEKKYGEMAYMENHFDMRLDPSKLVDGAKSVISLSYNYFTNQNQIDADAPKISKYAFGEDYHFVIKDKLKTFLQILKDNIGDFNGRVFVDSAPVMEKAWAQKSGIGWVGKNANLITQKQGSFFFLAEIILDIPLSYDAPTTDHCGTCTKCIDACPTQAIIEPYVVDGSKCISYFTIELKNEFPKEMKGKFDNWMFGCDVCQDVCPWNRFSKPHQESKFNASEKMLNMKASEWKELTEETFQLIFKNSAVKRTKYEGLKRNIDWLSK
jgi:epoxyqueuosine reductase